MSHEPASGTAPGEHGILVSETATTVFLTLDRPSRRNSLTTSMMSRIAAVMADVTARCSTADGPRLVVVRGSAKAFCSGVDLDGAVSVESSALAVDAANSMVRAIVECPVPVLAVVRGAAAGVGMSLALAADVAIAGRSAFFDTAFCRVGLMPDGGLTWLLPQAIGRPRAHRLALLGDRVSGAMAAEWGLVTECVDDTAIDGVVRDREASLVAGPRRALALTKLAIHGATAGSLPEAMEVERHGQLDLAGRSDYREGVDAFLTRRTPSFSDPAPAVSAHADK